MSDLPFLPAWAKTLQRRIRQRGIDFFILHGPGVRDLHPLGARRFGTIADCLAQVILNDRSAIVTYDRGAGIGFSDRDVENDFKTVLKAYDKLGRTNLAQVQPRDPDRALQLIETYLSYQLSGNPRFSAAVMIDYGETVAPAGEPGRSEEHTSELQSQSNLVCRLLLEKKKYILQLRPVQPSQPLRYLTIYVFLSLHDPNRRQAGLPTQHDVSAICPLPTRSYLWH